jgi:hypothetical protein
VLEEALLAQTDSREGALFLKAKKGVNREESASLWRAKNRAASKLGCESDESKRSLLLAGRKNEKLF